MSAFQIKQAGFSISQIAMGCEALGGMDWGTVDIEQAHAAVRKSLEAGVTVFDTADVYGLGRGEEELSKALGEKRHNVVIVTKFGVSWGKASASNRAHTKKNSSQKYMKLALEASLKRLRIEAIPLYLIHWPDPSVPIEETVNALEDAIVQGKIISYGVSNFNITDVLTLAQRFSVSASEGKFNLIEKSNSAESYAKLRRAGIISLIYGPLAQGLLTGKYNEKTIFSKTDRRHRLPHFSSNAWTSNRLLLKKLFEASEYYNRMPSQVAIRWVIDSGVSDSVICGAKDPVQVEINMGALGWKMGQSWLQTLSEASDAISKDTAPKGDI